MKRQFAKNLGSNWAVYLASALISFFLTPYIIGTLGQASYGVWILVGSFSGYLGIFDFGIGYAVVKFVARYQKTGEPNKRNEIIATAFYTAGLLSIIVIAATVFIAWNAAGFFDIPPELVRQSQIVILLVGISIAAAFPMGIFSDALSGGLWRFDLFNLVSLTISVFQAVLTIALLEAGMGLPGLGISALLGSAIGYFWRMRMLYKLLPDLSIGPSLVNFPVLKKIGNYSFFSFVLVLSGRIAFYSDSFIVGVFRGIEEVAVFGIAVKLTEYLRQLIFTLTKLFTPIASRYDPDTEKASLRRIFYDGSRLNLLVSLPLSAMLFFWGGNLIDIWIGPDFSYAKTILQILLIGHILSFTQAVGGELLIGVGRHRKFAIISMISGIVNIVLSIILVKRLGLVGVAWGTTIPLSIISIGYLPFATIRLIEGKFSEFISRAVVPAMLSSLAPVILVYLTRELTMKFGGIILWGGAVFLLFLCSAYLLGLKKDERSKIRDLLVRIFR
ncbi:MAG: MATE family efflux transporter [Candidatus Zixiibacteriota bacterium]